MEHKKESFHHLAGKIIACVDLKWLKNELIDQDAKPETISSVSTLSKTFSCMQLHTENKTLWENIERSHTAFTKAFIK